MGGLDEKVNFAIDSLSVTGKDTLTQILFYVLNHLEKNPEWIVIDSSAMYRALGLFLDQNYEELGISQFSKFEKLEKIIQGLTRSRHIARFVRLAVGYEQTVRTITSKLLIETEFPDRVKIQGLKNLGFDIDTSFYDYAELKTTLADTLSGYIAKFTSVRPNIIQMEREIAKRGYCIVPGRDGYSVVLQKEGLPKCFGLYPWANYNVRVKRRTGDRNTPVKIIEDEIRTRDERDTDPKSNNVPADMDEARDRGYITFDNSNMNIFEMGVAATKIVLSQLKIDIPEETVERLVHEANQHYNHKVDIKI